MPVWPPALPQVPLRDGYTDSAPSNLLRTDMDTGPAKVRRSGTARPHTVQATYVLYDDEAEILEEFILETLAGGALCFDWPHPTLKRQVRARIVPSDSNLFARSYYSQTIAWQYTLTLEYWPDAPITGA